VEQAESRIDEINQRFCEPGFFDTTPPDQVTALQQEQQKLQTEVDDLVGEWERIEAEMDEGGSE
jgi:hypothetical protein